MSARVTTAVDDNGRVLACKRATGPEDGHRLQHEAEVLGRARHPGVVELVECREVDGATTVYTSFAGTHSLETAPPLAVEEAGAVVAMLASTVADLHGLGIVHGRIDPSHVLVGNGGRPILCGFTGGGEEGTVAPSGPGAIAEFRDPAATVDGPLSRAVDVFGLGALLRVLAIGDGADSEPIPERRFSVRHRRPWSGYLRRSLLTLADHCTDEQPLRRPSAQRLAADIESLVPRVETKRGRLWTALGLDDAADAGDADQEGTNGPGDDPFATLRPEPVEVAPRSHGRLLVLGGAVIGLVLAFWSVTALRNAEPTAARNAPGAAPTTPPAAVPATTTGSATTSTTEVPSTIATTAPRASSPPTPTTDIVVAADGSVSIDGHRFAIGEPGDKFAIGDWDCNGSRTAAVARPATGEVFVFDAWPSTDHDVTAAPITSIEGAVDVRAEDHSGCSTLHVVRADGSDVEVQP
jgi:hypothetical protein